MPRRIFVQPEKSFVIEADAIAQLESIADHLRQGLADKVEQLRAAHAISLIVAKVREHPA
jgi:hypothetical protein